MQTRDKDDSITDPLALYCLQNNGSRRKKHNRYAHSSEYRGEKASLKIKVNAAGRSPLGDVPSPPGFLISSLYFKITQP